MGCGQINRSEIEIELKSMWDESEICKLSVDKFLHLVKDEIISKEINPGYKSFFEEIIFKIIRSDYGNDDDIFGKIRYHLIKEDSRDRIGYGFLFAFIFLCKGRYTQKVIGFRDMFLLLKDSYKLDGDILTDLTLLKFILVPYIDLVSFISLGYVMSLNKEKDISYINDLEETHKSYKMENRLVLCKELLDIAKSKGEYNLEIFLEENLEILDHAKIRDRLYYIEQDRIMNVGKIKIEENHEKNNNNNKYKSNADDIKGSILRKYEVEENKVMKSSKKIGFREDIITQEKIETKKVSFIKSNKFAEDKIEKKSSYNKKIEKKDDNKNKVTVKEEENKNDSNNDINKKSKTKIKNEMEKVEKLEKSTFKEKVRVFK